jgi:hypothetical protein
MASEIKVDTIVNAGGDNDTGIDLSTNDQILLKVANATKLTMNSTGQTTIVGEGGTTTTSLQQGLAKHWVMFDGSGTPAIQDSLNSASITDNGTADYTTNLTNNMSNSNFGYSASTGGNDIDLWGMASPGRSTSAIRIVTKYHANNNSAVNAADRTSMSSIIHGDLA